MHTSVDVLDVAALDRLQELGGQEFVVEMIELFLENAPLRVAAARTALSEGDLRSLYRAAHSLKSTSANVGAQRLRGVAERLESVAAAGGGIAIRGLVDEMDECYAQARGRLEAERNRRRAAEDQP